MRAYNHNITPGFAPAMASFLNWGANKTIPVTLVFDPNNAARCQTIYADDETTTGGGTLTIWANGASPFSVNCNVPVLGSTEGPSLNLKAGSLPFPHGAVARDPLPPFDTVDPKDGCAVYTTLPTGSPFLQQPKADPRVKRANSWSVTIPGVQWFPGISSKHPERILSWFFDAYPADIQAAYLAQYVKDGYTHIRFSLPDYLSRGGNFDTFIAQCLRAKAAGIPFVEVMLTSKDYDPAGYDLSYFQNKTAEFISKALAAKAVDIFVPGWEWNLICQAGDAGVYPILNWLAPQAHANGALVALHFTTYVTQWGNNGEEEDDFWNKVGHGLVDALNWQGNPSDSAGLTSAHINDAQRCFGRTGANAVLWADELVAEAQFDGDQPDEDHSDLRGLEALCTPGPVPISGFGNGARQANGNFL